MLCFAYELFMNTVRKYRRMVMGIVPDVHMKSDYQYISGIDSTVIILKSCSSVEA